MNFRIILVIILGFFIFNSLTYTHALPRPMDMDCDDMPDSTHKPNPDSVRESRERIADSIKETRQHATDSATAARKQKSDSLAKARKHITDSTASIRKYHDSKHYKDSVTRSRTVKANKLKNARQSHMDSLTEARKTFTDSLTSIRKTKTDSIKTVQKRRTDSLAKIKKYKASKRYSDSVYIARKMHTDSVQAAQQSFRDNLAKARKHTLDSAKAARKHTMDSVTAVRTKTLDSVKLVRKKRTDSLAKEKKLKEDLAKAKDKKKEDNLKLKLEIKMKQKHEAWSNASMLKKKWKPLRRFVQNSFTHYNYYYNAKKKMDEAQTNMQRSRKENYDSLIGLYPFDPNRDSSLMSSDMDTIVRKISVGIQIHDPRVKWSNDLYLLLGEAFYYRGKYDNASIAFRYIISKDENAKKKAAARNGYGQSNSKDAPSILDEDEKSGPLSFLKHKSVHNESVLWLARTYTEAHQVENAESILSLLESDAKFPADLKGRLAVEKAFAFLAENNFPAAVTQLSIAVDDNYLPYWLRMRAAFLHGQLLQNMGDYKNAAGSFEKVLTYFPKIEMDFYSRKYVAFNRLMAGDDIEDAMRPLKKVLTDGKYVNYYDQVYYVLGKLAVKANENGQAITYFTKSTTTPKATKKQKAVSYAELGDVYYATANYPAAKRAYDSASKYSSPSDKNASVTASLQRSKGLEEVSGPSKVIHDQDSLLALSALSKKEQLSVVRKYLRDLEKRQLDSTINAESTGVTAVAPSDPDDAGKDATNWYFGNSSLIQQGSSDFKKKWGARPLTDNWRRASGQSFASTSNNDDEDLVDADAGAKDNGLPTEESLLAKIPNTTPQKELSVKMIQRAYMLLTKAYMKQLEDYKMANTTLDTLDARYPDNNVKEEELYLRYKIAFKQDKLDKAKMYADQLLSKFPQSQYAGDVRPKHSESKQDPTIDGKTVSGYFDETYNLLMQRQYTEALMRISNGKKQFDNPAYKKRFEVAEAMGYAGTGDFNQADSIITKFLRTYPADTLTQWATTVKQYIKEVRNGGKPSWYNDLPDSPAGLAKKDAKTEGPDPKLTKPTTPPPPSDIPTAYSFVSDTDHYCIVVLPGIDSRTSGLKKAVKDLNDTKYSAAGLSLLFDLYNIDLGVLVVKKFKNSAEAKNYMNDLLASDAVKGYAPGELQVAIVSSPNYKKMFADKNTQPYLTFYGNSYH